MLAERSSRGTTQTPVIVDEVQKIPELLDEVHWLIENAGVRPILCGSSARKLKRGHANLLGGRAIRCELLPLTRDEIPEFSLERALRFPPIGGVANDGGSPPQDGICSMWEWPGTWPSEAP